MNDDERKQQIKMLGVHRAKEDVQTMLMYLQEGKERIECFEDLVVANVMCMVTFATHMYASNEQREGNPSPDVVDKGFRVTKEYIEMAFDKCEEDLKNAIKGE